MKKFRNSIIIGAFLIIPVIWMTWSVMKDVSVRCRVCMQYAGHENCGNAEGNNKESCVRTATDNACATIASGMTASIQCNQRTPISVELK